MATPAAEQLPPIDTTNLHPQQPPPPMTDVDDPSHPLYHHRRTVADFDYGEALGEGSYSTVLVARDKKTDKQYAVKKLDKAHIVKNDKVKYVMIERDALSRMNHPGIVKLYWTFRDNRSLYYVIDLAPHGELYTFIRKMAPLDIETTRYYASEILLAVEHIHSRDVVHRDIKPENILLDDHMHIKIADFGSAKLLYDTNTTNQSSSGARSFVGTAQYVAPELLRSDPTSKEADWWAFGCVIFQMLSGRSPFKAATDYLIFQKIKNLDYEFPENFPLVAKDLVEQLLVMDADSRLGSEALGGVVSIKAHPFFQDVDFDQVFHQPPPPKAQQYMDDWKWQQSQQQLNREKGHLMEPDDDDDGFETWFNGNEQHKVDQILPQQQHYHDQQASPRQRRQQRYQQEQYYREAQSPVDPPTDNPFNDDAAAATPTSITLPADVPPHSLPSSPLDPPSQSDAIDSTLIHPSTSSASSNVTTTARPTTTNTTFSPITDPSSSSSSSPRRPHFIKTNSTQATFSTRHSTHERLGNQSHPPWIAHLYPSESIVRAGRVKRRGLFPKKRYLILTDRPRLLYLDEGQQVDGSGGGLRCEIGWSSKLLPELKGKSLFSIHTPEKSYTFDVAKGQAEDWVNTLNTMLVDSFGLAA